MDQNTDFKWFLEHYESLYKKYGNSFLVIKNEKVLGSFQTYGEGVEKTMKKEPLGSFIVQKCSRDKIAATNAFVASINF